MKSLSLIAAAVALLSTGLCSVRAQDFGDAPAPKSDAPPADPTKAIQKIDGTRFRLGAMEFDQKTREISIPCTVNMREGLLEYILVHESGKVHESLFSTAVKPMELNVVMLLLNWKKSEAFFDFSQPERGGVPVKNAKNPPVSHVEIHVAWKDKDGKDQTCRVENWLHQIEKKAKISQEPFIYTGSVILPDGQFLSEQTGSMVGLYVDPGSIINNPRDGNELDDVWIADEAVPAKATPVTLIIKPVAAAAEPAAPAEKAAPAKPVKKKSSR